MCNTLNYFVESVDIRKHPLITSRKKTRVEYYTALSYIVKQATANITNQEGLIVREYISKRLDLYKQALCPNHVDVANEKCSVKAVSACLRRPWRAKQRIWIMCDLALVLLDRNLIQIGSTTIKQCLSKHSQAEIDALTEGLITESPIYSRFPKAEEQIRQYLNNQKFLHTPKRKVIVTANMSAGKSTLINALIGKPIARTSQEVCTGSVCYLYNKALEDNKIHLSTGKLTLDATDDELRSYQWNGAISIASYFASLMPEATQMCLIDTPGVDAALYKQHTKQTHDALLNQDYDSVIYVVSPTNLGTDSENKHLIWVYNNVPHEKIIFVLNKLDDYRSCSDSIEESIQGLREDLTKVGFENPIICPISAYFSFLLKLKLTGQPLSADETDEYAFFAKKFMRSSYDLSRFYVGSECLDTDTEEVALCKRSGLYGLEKLIYGGRV